MSADTQLQLEKFSSWHTDCTVDDYLCGKGKTISHPGEDWSYNRTCYGTIRIPSNKSIIATWKIKIVSMGSPTYVCIGIDSIERTEKFFAGNKNAPNYGYGDDGKMYAAGIVKAKKQTYGKHDLIILKLNTAVGVLECYRNGLAEEAFQHSFRIKKHPNIVYKLAVSIKRAKVSIVGFDIKSVVHNNHNQYHKNNQNSYGNNNNNRNANQNYNEKNNYSNNNHNNNGINPYYNQYHPSAPPESPKETSAPKWNEFKQQKTEQKLEEKTNDTFGQLSQQYYSYNPPPQNKYGNNNNSNNNNNCGVVWQVKLSGEWKDYDDSVSEYIESKYCQQNMKIFDCTIRNAKYYINLDSMTQSNSYTGRKRDIRRCINNNNNNNYTSQQQQNQYNNQNNQYNQQYSFT